MFSFGIKYEIVNKKDKALIVTFKRFELVIIDIFVLDIKPRLKFSYSILSYV